MKALIFDSGPLITLSMNSMLDILRDLKKNLSGKFLITRDVEHESVIRPMEIKKYKLGAIRIKGLINENILEFPESLGISDKLVKEKSEEFLRMSNSVFYANKRPIHLIDTGEASCVALSSLLYENGIDNVIVIDERTTRMLFEKPENLKKLFESKLHTNVNIDNAQNIKLKNIKFIRSAELIYVAFKKKLIKNPNSEMLDAMLYGVKFKGCSISNEEIKEIERLAPARV